MKKGIMIFLSVLVLAIGGFFFVNNADATGTANPRMELETSEVLLEGYKGASFKFKFTVNPGSIEYDPTNPEGDERILKKNSLKVALPSNLILESAKRGNETLDVVGSSVNLGDILYKSGFIDGKRCYIGENFDVELTFKAIAVGKIDGFNESFTLEYEDLKGNRGKGIFKSKFSVNIGEILYEIGTIQGNGIKEANESEIMGNTISMEYPLNRYFTMKYSLNPGVLKVLDGKGEEVDNSNLDVKSRDLIYVVDKSVLDLKGGNEETARESMIKSLEILKQEAAEVKGYLILVGKKAEVVEINKRSLLSIDELIDQISKAEAETESGNLGDAVRRAQMISDKNVENDSSVVLVTNGNPNYYTQVSKGQKSLLYTRVDKDGHNEKDRHLADKYANEVVNDIVVNEDDNTRWYSVNYGERVDELVVDELIKKLDGYALKVQSPYYDDFARINEKAISPIILKGKITAKVNEKYKNSIAVASEDREQNIELIFDSKANEVKANQIEFDIKAKIIDGGEMESLGFDVADSEVIEVKFIVDSYDKQEHIFNKKLDETLENTELLTWRVKPTIPYVARMGLFNGNLTANLSSLSDKNLSTEDLLSLAQIAVIANNSLDELDMCDLAINNEFGYGMVIKPKVEDTIRPIIKENGKVRDLGNEGVFTLYKLNAQTNRFEKIAIVDPNEIKLEGNQIYLITVDMMVQERFLNQSFEIGVEVNSSWNEEVIVPDENGNDNTQPQIDDLNDSVKEYWTIKVNGVAQPEHF